MNIKIDLYLIISIAVLIFFRQIEPFIYFYVFVIFHEFSHILVALILKIKVLEINFLPFGVNAKFDFEIHKIKEIFIASAGPVFSACMAYFFKEYMVQNLFICITNLLPIYPLDGGRILKNTMILLLGQKLGAKFYNNLLIFLIILLLIFNIIVIIFLRSFQFLFVSFYIIQIAEEELKKDKIKNKIMSIYNSL